MSEHKTDYYRGKKFSFRQNDIWYISGSGMNSGRQYMLSHPIIEELRKVKPLGGSFTISKEGVFTKVGREIIKISNEVPNLEEDEERKPFDIHAWTEEDSERLKNKLFGE